MISLGFIHSMKVLAKPCLLSLSIILPRVVFPPLCSLVQRMSYRTAGLRRDDGAKGDREAEEQRLPPPGSPVSFGTSWTSRLPSASLPGTGEAGCGPGSRAQHRGCADFLGTQAVKKCGVH